MSFLCWVTIGLIGAPHRSFSKKNIYYIFPNNSKTIKYFPNLFFSFDRTSEALQNGIRLTPPPKIFSGQNFKKPVFWLFFDHILSYNVTKMYSSWIFFMKSYVFWSAKNIFTPMSTSKNQRKGVKIAPENFKMSIFFSSSLIAQ